MGRILKRLSIGFGLLAAVALVIVLTNAVERFVFYLEDRVGAGWMLGIVVAATVLLAATWLRYGGARALRRWGLVLKPRLPEEGTADQDAGPDPERTPRLVGPR